MLEFEHLIGWLIPLSAFVGALALSYVMRMVTYRQMVRWAKRTATQLDDIVVASVQLPSLLWIVIVSLLIGVQFVPLSAEFARLLDKTLLVLLISSFTLVAARLTGAVIQRFGAQWMSKSAMPIAGLTQTLAQTLVIALGLLFILSALGVDITPLLTALGIGGLAVALALQDTLTNLFAGLHILIARQIHLGQRIKLDSGEEGYVTDIGWRNSTLRTPSNHLVIIPNAKLSQSIVTNYNMPNPPVNIVIPVGVSYDCDPEHVEQVLQSEAKSIIVEVPGFVKDFEPIVRFQAFGDFSLNFLLIVQVEHFDAQFGVWGELHKRLFKRLRQEGIEIPFPVRTVYLKGDPPKASSP